jgi:hypothetical protein
MSFGAHFAQICRYRYGKIMATLAGLKTMVLSIYPRRKPATAASIGCILRLLTNLHSGKVRHGWT